MTILLISAHDDPRSFVGAIHNTALATLERAGHKVLVTDLYAQGFNAVASSIDFKTKSGVHANYMFEQQRSINTKNGFSPDIQGEMDKVSQADLIIFHFPLWWASVPAILKGWFDRVFAMGFAWSAEGRYNTGLLRGKRALLVASTGDPISYYQSDGMHRATVEQHLYVITHHTLAFCGFDVLQSVIISNTTAASETETAEDLKSYATLLESIDQQADYIYKH
jgi:NAD(P)H dehydrogenase (quinone)